MQINTVNEMRDVKHMWFNVISRSCPLHGNSRFLGRSSVS